MSNVKFTLQGTNSDEAAAELQAHQGTLGPEVIDVRSLYTQTGRFTFDPGFASTASCESAITFIDGNEGVLLYRGYPVEQLAAKSSFLEVCYLLLYGDLPNKPQLADFDKGLYSELRAIYNDFSEADALAIKEIGFLASTQKKQVTR